MKAYVTLFILLFAFSGCGEVVNSSESFTHVDNSNIQNLEKSGFLDSEEPSVLAKQCCKCWNEVKTISNSTGKARKADLCSALTMQKLAQLQEIGVANDWDERQVKIARDAFDIEYNKCE